MEFFFFADARIFLEKQGKIIILCLSNEPPSSEYVYRTLTLKEYNFLNMKSAISALCLLPFLSH